jgi:beta-lactamase regulating signal transducer with metallopeptidase domain
VTTLSLGNFAIYSAQVLLVVVAATIGARVVAPAPRPRLAFWRAIIVACLLLPFWPTRRIDVATIFSAPIATETVRREPGATEPFSRAPLGLIPWLLLAGATARGVWLTIGVLQLRRLRMRGVPAVLDGDVEALRRVLAPHAELRWDEHIDQPLTFGLRRPIVLLPRQLTDLPPDSQRAVVCHELVHVARHDWAWTLIEEAVQTAFWFHPAM